MFVLANGFTSFNTTSADSTQLCISAAAAGEDFWCMLPLECLVVIYLMQHLQSRSLS